MPNVRLRDVADINPEGLGADLKSDVPFKYIDLSSVSRGAIDWSKLEIFRSSTAPSRAQRRVRPGDCLFGTVRPAQQSHGFVDRDRGPLVASTGFSVLRAKIGLAEPRFIYHWMLSEGTLRQAERVAVGSNYPAVNESDVADFIVQLPSIYQQRRIAEILDALDARIRCQDQLIAKLVAVQQGLESSLLDMPDISSESLANYLASSPKNGYSPKEVDEWTGMVALGLGCLTANGFQPRQLKNVPSGDARNVGAVLRDGDLLMSRANTRELVGLVGIYKDVGYDCIYPDLMMRLTPTKRCRVGYLELVLRSSAVRRQIQGMAQGTSESMVKISSSVVQDLKVQIPDLAVQDRILEVVDAARARRDAEEAVRDGLLRLKAGLAEDLLTGRVRVPEAEAVVESL